MIKIGNHYIEMKDVTAAKFSYHPDDKLRKIAVWFSFQEEPFILYGGEADELRRVLDSFAESSSVAVDRMNKYKERLKQESQTMSPTDFVEALLFGPRNKKPEEQN